MDMDSIFKPAGQEAENGLCDGNYTYWDYNDIFKHDREEAGYARRTE